jgi:hypothetical protein
VWAPIEGEKWGTAAAAFCRISDADKWAIEDYVLSNGNQLDTDGAWLCVWIRNRGWETLQPASASNQMLSPNDILDMPGRIFVEEDSLEWKWRTQIALNNGRVHPTATSSRRGKPGHWFAIENPPLATNGEAHNQGVTRRGVWREGSEARRA